MSKATRYTVTAEGELTENWAIWQPGFAGSIRQLVCCARCGDELPPAKHDGKRHFCSTPVVHLLCDECFDALPD